MIARSIPGWALTISEEDALSKKFMREIARRFTFIDDPGITRYVTRVGERIVGVLPRNPYRFRFFVIKDDAYNAFAGPGGVIFVNSGLLAAMDNPGELAGILGHEVVHVYSRHISDRIDRSKQIGIVTLAGLVAAIALGATGAGAAANAMVMGSMAAGQTLALSYSRADEMQADQLGVKILVKAGYHPGGLVSMLEKIRQKQWVDTTQFPTYLRTHPAAEDRMAYISAWIDRQKNLPAVPSVEDRTAFAWIRARVTALYGDKNKALTDYSAAVEKAPDDPVANYGDGLVLERIGHYREAARHLKRALASHLFDADLLVDLGRVYFQDGRYQAATDTLKGALEISPDNMDGRYYLGRTLLNQKDFSAAVNIFGKLLHANPDYRDLMYFAGQAYGKQGNLKDAYYYLGRFYYRKGRIRQAIVQLEKAGQLADDAERKKEIKQMLKTLKAEFSHRK